MSAEPGRRARPDGEPLFAIRDLRKSYGSRVVLDGLELDIGHGESLVILGRSGTGKSVTLRLLGPMAPYDFIVASPPAGEG